MNREVIAAVDLGTTKISVVIGGTTSDGLRLLGSGQSLSMGIKKGSVEDIGSAAAAIRSAVSEAEATAGIKISSAIFGISGRHISGITSSGIACICNGHVTEREKLLVLESAKAVYIPLDRELLHAIAMEFIVDGREGISDPIGVSGVKLESRMHIITADSCAMKDIEAAADMAGLKVSDMVFGPIASARAVLSKAEAKSGAIIVDIGGGTTDIAYVKDGFIRDTSVLGIGGMHITNDLAVGLGIDFAEAEKIKISAGKALLNPNGERGYIETTTADGVIKARKDIVSEIIRCRCEEIFELAGQRMLEARKNGNLQGIVITGGTAGLHGLPELSSAVLNLPARVGMPEGISGIGSSLRTPACASVIGLALYSAGQRCMKTEGTFKQTDRPDIIRKLGNRFKNIFNYKDFLETFNRRKKGATYV